MQGCCARVGPLRAAALAAAILVLPALAQTPGPLPRDVEKIGDERYRIGKLTVDLRAKTAECPGRINMRRGTIEYLAVAPGGKLHESALELDVRPLHLQVGLILLGLEAGGGLRYQGDTRPPRGSPIELWVSWTRNGRSLRVPAGELVWDIDRKKPMGTGSWVFSGLPAGDQAVAAEKERSLIATYRDPAAVINTTLEAGGDDTAYKINERIAPPTGTPVVLTIKPTP